MLAELNPRFLLTSGNNAASMSLVAATPLGRAAATRLLACLKLLGTTAQLAAAGVVATFSVACNRLTKATYPQTERLFCF